MKIRQQQLLKLIRLLKIIKISRMMNGNKGIHKNTISKYKHIQQLTKRKNKILALRSYYINLFIENKKKEMDYIRGIMDIKNITDNNDSNKDFLKKQLKQSENMDKNKNKNNNNKIMATNFMYVTEAFIKKITEKTVRELITEPIENDYLNDIINEIVEQITEENGINKLMKEHEIIQIVKYKMKQINAFNETNVYNETNETNVYNETNDNIIIPNSQNIESLIPKILVVIACHTNNNLRFNVISSIMKYLEEIDNIDIVIVNSANTHLSKFVQNAFKGKYLKYLEINNDNYYGFSKWIYGVGSVNILDYKFTTFINDSVLVHGSLRHFFDYTRFIDVDLYGYNDSTQIKYHYQSYLFSIKNTNLQPFIRMVNDNKKSVNTYMDAVVNYELKLVDYYPNRDCFMRIAYIPSQKGQNIFYSNDFLYTKIRDSGLLPFTKLKRIS